MERTITVHQPTSEGFSRAILDAYAWVNEADGTLLFVSKSDKEKAVKLIATRRTAGALSQPDESHEMHVGFTDGGHFHLCGPRIAAISVDESGMKRVEDDIANFDLADGIEELRSYARNPDKHKKWTELYQPESLDWFC